MMARKSSFEIVQKYYQNLAETRPQTRKKKCCTRARISRKLIWDQYKMKHDENQLFKSYIARLLRKLIVKHRGHYV